MTISRVLMAAAAALVLGCGPAVAEQDTPGQLRVTSPKFRVPVVELYTSEGCSSCPRADKWISKLGTVIDDEFAAVPLAFHVDYWNYLGWEDPYSKAQFTQRQRELGAINRQRSIYTPEFLVSGEETRGTSAVVAAIEQANEQPADVSITMRLEAIDANALQVTLEIDNGRDDGVLYLAMFESGIVRDIGGGENHGRTLVHDFVVRHWESVANIKAGQYSGVHTLALGQDWNRDRVGVAAAVLDRRDAMTLQAVRLDIGPLFGAEKLALRQ